MKKLLTILAVLIGLFLLAGAAIWWLVPQKKILAAAMPEIENLKITDARIGEEKATMLVNVDLTSKLIPVFVDSMQYEMRLFDQTVSKGHKKFATDSKKGKVQTLDLTMTMNHNQTRELVRRQVAEDAPVQIIMKAYCDIPVLGKKDIDIEKELDMVVPALPGMEVKDVSIKDFGLDNMEMIMTMAIDNPNEFDFYIRDMKYDLVLQDFIVSNGNITKDQLVKARSVTPIALTSNADTKKPIKNTFKMLTGKTNFPYTMTSRMVIEPRTDVVGTVKINSVKTGSVDVAKQLKNIKETKQAKKEAEKNQEEQQKKN